MSTAMNRLVWWHWLLIGFGASLILFLILFFTMIKPRNDDAARITTEAKGIEDAGGTPDKVSSKKNELKNKQAETVRINHEWQNQSSVYMPPIDFNKDPLKSYEYTVYRVNGKAYGVKDLPAVWGQWITFWYGTQWRQGIVPLSSFPIESFSSDPNDVSQLKAIAFPQTKPWDVEVSAKNFDAAMNHLRRFNTIQLHGMPVVDKVALSGQSPDLRVKYTLQMFVIPPTAPPAADPKISGTAAGSGGGGPSMGGSMNNTSGMGGLQVPGGGGKGKMGGM